MMSVEEAEATIKEQEAKSESWLSEQVRASEKELADIFNDMSKLHDAESNMLHHMIHEQKVFTFGPNNRGKPSPGRASTSTVIA